MATGLLLLRLVVGTIMFGHGTQKLFGWFDGHGRDGTASFFGSLGYRKPKQMAVIGGLGETIAGVGLFLGFLTPLAAAALIGVMVNAIVAVHRGSGPWNTQGGWEYNAVLATVAATLAFTGPGAVSLDAALGLGLNGVAWGVLAILLGLVAAGAALAMRSETAPAAAAGGGTDVEDEVEVEERAAA